MDIKRLLSSFCKEIGRCDHILTEDSVRYAFFACLLKQDPDLNHYILELPYQKMDGQTVPIHSDLSDFKDTGKDRLELDMFYWTDNTAFCFEFKFHRTGDANSAYANPDAAGGVFNDLKRLQTIHSSCNIYLKKIMVYLTDTEMDQYLGNPQKHYAKTVFRQDLKEFYNLPQLGRFTPMAIRAQSNKTFRESSSKSFKYVPDNYITIAGIDLLYRGDKMFVPKDCSSFSGSDGAFLRIYEVK